MADELGLLLPGERLALLALLELLLVVLLLLELLLRSLLLAERLALLVLLPPLVAGLLAARLVELLVLVRVEPGPLLALWSPWFDLSVSTAAVLCCCSANATIT